MHHITGIQENDGPFPLWLTRASFLGEVSWAHTDKGLPRGGRFPTSEPEISGNTEEVLPWALRRKSTTVRGWIKTQLRTAGSVEGGSTGKTDFKSGKGNLELRLE